ncbi:hypothetical protein HPO96_03260 [Kribbella sandramycini]|uniref:HEAT repeat protein n=1 Tax=Kribbella sandramycini TaxID=60450 RepID=A0A7Y4KV23_9ACTN|nr:HEAT repeat domain-containing protein [Kribbella sandramycini]MBB6568151.1 hypothetical protein [Kribbella sandramycini]NOL39255.1 hypothetical protein [Kribbella sandramycini]
MRAQELLRSIDDLPYGERLRRLSIDGRALPAAERQTLLAELAAGTPFERSLGLTIAQATSDVAYVTRLLRDPVPAVQSQALAAVGNGVPVSDDDLRILYDDAPAALRTRLLHLIRKTRRTLLAARLIDDHRERWGDQAAAGLLNATDAATVERLLPELAYCLGPGEWRRLGARHPDAVLAHTTSILPSGPDRDEWWQGPAYGVLGALDRQPTQATLLLIRALPPGQLPTAIIEVLGRLLDHDPLVLEILLDPDIAHALPQALTPAVRRRLYRYPDDDLVELGHLLRPDLTPLLEDLPPSRRAKIFTAVTRSVDLGQRVLPGELLTALPHKLRAEQTRRMLTLPKVTDNLHEKWRITAFLPYDEAFARLDPEVRRADADERATVYRSVIQAAGHSRRPAAIESALSWATRVRNDRSAVRTSVLQGVGELPPSMLADALVPTLQTLLTDALEARDSDWNTQRWLTRISETAIRQGAMHRRLGLLEWGLQAHARITENKGTISLYGVIDGLPRGEEVAVYAALRPYVDHAVARKEFQLPFAIARAFDERGWTIEHLQEVLEAAVWSNQENTVNEATELWLRPSRTRAARIERIIKRDVGMARWNAVWQAVTGLRTDLLDTVLNHPAKIRRFERTHRAWAVRDQDLRHWLPRQQARYAELVAGAAADERMPEWARANAVSTLGRVPQVGRAALEPFLDDENVLVQEAALKALAWTDSPQEVLPVLLAHAGDDRARVAMYAATRAARFVRPSLLPGLLHPILIGAGMKVTSRKEAARLLGSLRAPGASAVLTDAWTSAHRDVRAAITSAASLYLLHEPASWALLQQAVHDSDATAIVLTQRPAYGLATKYRARYADLLVAVANRPEPEVVRAALRAMPRWAQWSPSVAPVCAGFIADLRARTWTDATSALVAIVAADPQLGLDDLLATVRLLVRLEDDPNLPNAAADRDHPARQRLTILADRLPDRTVADRQTLRAVAAELVGPELLSLKLGLLVRAIEWSELATLVEAIGDRPLTAYQTANSLSARLSQTEAQWTPEQLEPIARELIGSAPLFAWAIIGAAGRRTGWAPAWRDLLIALRNHPEADVRQLALEILTAAEG